MNRHLAAKSCRLFTCLMAAAWCLPLTESKSDELEDAATRARDSMLGKDAGQLRDDNGFKIKLVWCPPGFFKMESVEMITEVGAPTDGSNDDEVVENEKPADNPRKVLKVTPVKVSLSNGYWLGKYEVTQAEWKRVMTTSPWRGRNLIQEGDDFPATFVTWDESMEFCRKLTERERLAGRLAIDWEYTLPTEAQWERACRARSVTAFSFGDDHSKLNEFAWFEDNSTRLGEQYARRVGQKKANSWGLFDMHGNAWEWCRDVYVAQLPGGRDPEVKRGSSDRVFRGGGWRSAAASCRSSSRFGNPTGARDYCLGFRVALSPIGDK